jgi:opacity protein-like surface antigen
MIRQRVVLRLLDRALIGALLLLALVLLGVNAARADGQIVPSVGMTRAVDGDDTSKISGGLAVRGDLLPFLMAEIGASYRSDEYFGGDLDVRQWPVTASLYVRPVSAIYAGGGVGWYHTTFDYAEDTGVADRTSEEFGVHLGGGLQVPIAPIAALDLSGRYVMLRSQEAHLVPEKFDPDFWTTSLGLAIKF